MLSEWRLIHVLKKISLITEKNYIPRYTVVWTRKNLKFLLIKMVLVFLSSSWNNEFRLTTFLCETYTLFPTITTRFPTTSFQNHFKISLEKHEKTHLWKRTYECPKCDKKFGNTSNRDKHIRAKHEFLKPYQCNLCDKKYSDPSNLKLHLRKSSK